MKQIIDNLINASLSSIEMQVKVLVRTTCAEQGINLSDPNVKSFLEPLIMTCWMMAKEQVLEGKKTFEQYANNVREYVIKQCSECKDFR